MVQVSTLILAAVAVAPVLSAPLSVPKFNTEIAQQRSVDDAAILELRDPKFSFGKAFKKVAGAVTKYAVPAASLLLRDVDGNVIERELDLSELAELDARSPEPKFNFGKLLRGGLKVAKVAAGILIRDEEGNVYIRELDMDDLSERDLLDLDLDTREPFSLRKIVKKVGSVAGKATRIATTVANVAGSLGLREFDEAEDVDARDLYFLDLSDMSERDLAELDLDLESREPLRFGNLIKKVGGIAGKATRIAGTVANVASSLGFRDLEDIEEVDARDAYYAIDDVLEREYPDDLEELDARDPKFRLGSVLKRVGGIAKTAVGVAGHVANVAGSLGLRELEDEIEMEARSIDELD